MTTQRRPNILWYCSDQQRWDTIGALGNPHVHTPHLDRLAREGVAFTCAYTQSPLCTPSRASFLTGRYPSTLHVNTNGNTHFPPQIRLAPRRLADAGYDTGLVGKLHLAGAYYGREPRIDDGYRSFQYSHAPRHDWKVGHDYADWIKEQGEDPAAVLRPRKGTPGGLVEPKGPGADEDNVPPRLHQTTWSTEKTLEFIGERRPDGQPWMVSVNPYYPHPPFNPPWEFYRRFDPESLPGPHFRESDLVFQNRLLEAGVDFQSPPRRPEEFEGKKLQAAYYAQVEMIDDALGRIVAELERTGQRENTLIVFHSDHGEALGDHGLTQKGCRFYDGLVRVPLLFSMPGTIREGLVSDALVELTDVFPTLMEACGLPIPKGTHGRSLLPLLAGQAPPERHRDFVRTEYYDAVDLPARTWATMYRDRQHKLIAYHGTGAAAGYGELYDMQADPHEFESLWDDPAHQALKMNLLQRSYDATVRAMEYGPQRVMPY
jgi:arylsulfatase